MGCPTKRGVVRRAGLSGPGLLGIEKILAATSVCYEPSLKNPITTTAGMLEWTVNLIYRIVFECPNGHPNINLQKKCRNVSLSEVEAMKLFGDKELSCTNLNCGWHGKGSKTKLLRFLPSNWILTAAT